MLAGNVKFSVYWWYWKAQGLLLFAVFGVLFVIYQGVQIFSNIWLSRMGNKDEVFDEIKAEIPCFPICGQNLIGNMTFPPGVEQIILEKVREIMRYRMDRYLWVYFGLGFVQAFFMFGYNLIFAFMAAASCKSIHTQLLGTNTCYSLQIRY